MDTTYQRSLGARIPKGCYANQKVLYVQNPWTPVQKKMARVAETPSPNAMPLPFYIGRQVLNSSIIHRPAWSFPQSIERIRDHYPAGPASYNVRDHIAKGGKAPASGYTMRIKPKTRPPEDLPGPATYQSKAQSLSLTAPSFTFRLKPMEAKILKTPAPNEYTLPTVLGHHKTPPAHIMGHKSCAKPTVQTPGPGDYSDEDFNIRLPHAPEFTIRKQLTSITEEGTPGPGSYCPERVILNRPVAPKQTMGIKHGPFSGMWHPRIFGPRHC